MVAKKTSSTNQKKQENKFAPTSYKQAVFLNADEDFIVYGGSRGSGKTFMSLLRMARWIDDPNFVGYVIRKHGSELKRAGGAFEEASKIFKALRPDCEITTQPMKIKFRNGINTEFGASISFVGLDGSEGKNAIQGIQISAAMVDEATHLTADEIWWIVTCLRTSAKMKPHIYLTCNPDPDSFLSKMVEPYLYPLHTYVDGELVEGRPHPLMNCKVRYFIKVGDDLLWAESEEELKEKHPEYFFEGSEITPQSFRFIGATCHDNPVMLKNNPTYISKLKNQDRITVERMYYGNWFARAVGTGFVQRDWFEVIPKIDKKVKYRVRAWDIAATQKSEKNPDPDYTASVLIARTIDDEYVIEDVFQERISIMNVLETIARVAKDDQQYCDTLVKTYIPQDPNAQAEFTARTWVRELASKGVGVQLIKTAGAKSKAQRFLPFAAVAEVGLIKVLKADWNDKYFSELERFDGTRKCGHDDKQTCRL